MNLFRALPSLAAAAFAFAISANSAAYCLTYTCDTKKEVCPMEAGCNVGGHPLFWARSVVSFDVQKDGSKRQDIGYEQLHAVVRNAFQRWVNADCGDGSHRASSRRITVQLAVTNRNTTRRRRIRTSSRSTIQNGRTKTRAPKRSR